MSGALQQRDERALATSSWLYVRTLGRRSGRLHRVPVWFCYEDGHVYLLAHARPHRRGTDWYQNLVAAGHAVLELPGGRRLDASYEPFDDPRTATGEILARFRGKYGAGSVNDWYVADERVPVRLCPGGSRTCGSSGAGSIEAESR